MVQEGRAAGSLGGSSLVACAVGSLASVLVLSGCLSAPSATPSAAHSPAASSTSIVAVPPVTDETSTRPPPGSALATLMELPVKGRAPLIGYRRVAFGPAWHDSDRNGCDTRNDILRRDLVALVLTAGTNGCVVLRGTLHDPYTGRTIGFVRGHGTSAAVQIDHVVALGDAWQKGAQRLTVAQRTALANDPLNLLAVDGPINEAKGDGDAATWLPPRTAYRCAYVARQVAVKAAYRLWVTSAERDAIRRVLARCPTQKLPSAGRIPLGGGKIEAAPSPTTPATAARGSAGLDPRYPSCRAARAAGFGPYVRGKDPEYDWYRDADGDGVVCE